MHLFVKSTIAFSNLDFNLILPHFFFIDSGVLKYAFAELEESRGAIQVR